LKIIADTNLLLRSLVEDDPIQSPLAQAELDRAEAIALPLPALCELVWVLSHRYGLPAGDIADAMRRLTGSAKVLADRPAIEAGLISLEGGGDFADGVIAYEGERLGGEEFVSFDRRAVKLIAAQGRPARTPA